MSKQSKKSSIKQVGSIAEVGFMANYRAKKNSWALKGFEEIKQRGMYHHLLDMMHRAGKAEKEKSKKAFIKPQQVELSDLNEELWRALDIRYEKLLGLFNSRFEEETKIFDGIDTIEVFAVFEQMAQLMLLFSPIRISADITFDRSVILQGHYMQGSFKTFRFYWETFLHEAEPSLYHSTLNVYYDQRLFHTCGGRPEEIATQFCEIVFAELV